MSFYHYSSALQGLADELNLKLSKKLDDAKKKKLEQVKRRKAAKRAGVFPGMGRKTKPFPDKKKRDRKNRCRKKKLDD